MPRLKDIERFKHDLAVLSREPEVLAQWGEKIEEPPLPPEADRPTPAEAAPEGGAEPRGLAARASLKRPGSPPATSEEGAPPDFESLLADLPLESTDAGKGIDEELEALLGTGSPEEERPSPTAAAEGGEGLSGEQAGSAESPEGMEDMEALLSSFGDAGGASGSAEEAAEPDFGLPDLDSFELPGDAEPAPEPAAPPPPEEAVEPDFGLPDLDSFELPGDAEPASEPAAPPPPEEAAEPDFGLPDLDSFELPGDAEPASEPAAPPPPEEAAEPDFGLPDLDSFELPGDAGGTNAPATPEATATPESFSFEEPGADSIELGGFEEGPEPIDKGTAVPGGQPEPEGLEIGEGGTEGGKEFDAFDSFSFDEPAATGLAGEALDRELAALGEETSPAATFNLESDWGGDFSLPGREEKETAASKPGAAPRREAEEKVREVSLTEEQVDRLQDRLLALPLNLRVAIEDIVSNEKGTEAQRSRLIWMLVEDASPDELSGLATRVLKRRIVIPAGYEKRTGAAFEAEKGSFRYLFVRTILPILRTALLALLVAGVLGFLGWRYIYRPLAANALYRTGYERIAADRFPEAEDAFAKAGLIREFKAWYYRYAEAYAKKRQYILAEKKYEKLLARFPKETQGALDWATLEREQLKYREAARILERLVLERDYLNRDALLLLGDVYLDWATEDSKYYDEARRNYAALIQRYGAKDPYLERMLLFFVRTDKLSEVLPLKERFLVEKKSTISAPTLAELGGYLFDKGKLEDVHRILMLAVEKDPEIPESHYHLARYYRRSDAPGEERKALDNAVRTFEQLPALSTKRLGMFIDALIWRGRYRFDAREYVAAEEDFSTAATEYDKALELKRLGRTPRYAEAYAGLGDIAYWVRDDLDQALQLYQRAAAHGYETPDTHYSRGYILYRQDRLADALEQFYLAGRDEHESPYLLFAFGNALYARADYYTAEGYYRRVVDAMRTELERLEQPAPQGRPSHEEIVELLMQAENNLGVTLYKVANRLGTAELRASGMAALAESARLFDALTRDQQTLVRPDAKNLGFLNMDFILHPQRGIDLAVYSSIERSMRFPRK